jgi:hypothetical protein
LDGIIDESRVWEVLMEDDETEIEYIWELQKDGDASEED